MTPARLATLAFAVLTLGVVAGAGMPGTVPDSGTVPGTSAWRQIDLLTRRPTGGARDDSLDRSAAPGSTMQLPVLLAALESGAISPRTRMACPGYAEVDGRRFACPHPRIRRPIDAAEALSYSCNAFFAAAGARLSRDRLDRVLAALGLPRSPAGAPMPLVAMGKRASPVAPSALLLAFTSLVNEAVSGGTSIDGAPRSGLMSASTRAVVVEGLRGTAVFGTADAFSARGVQALAITGTSEGAGADARRLVLAAWPPARPSRALVLLAAGGTAREAAGQAALLAGGAAPAAAVVPVRPQTPADEAAVTTVRVGFASSSGYGVRSLEIEDYVARVIAGEAAPRSAPSALEALAITVRTFAFANRGRHAREGFDLCDQTHCQVLREPYAAARAAAAATAGLILTWQGAPASVYYTASCGGRTERPSNVWPGAEDPPFLPSRRDQPCDEDPPWSSEIAEPDLRRALSAAGFRGGTVGGLRVEARSESGRVLQLRMSGMTPGEISGQALRMAVGRALGWQLLKSAEFDVHQRGRRYRFVGRGYGHGVGFCVVGAARRAASGAPRTALLEQYFPGLRVVGVTPGMLRQPVTPVVGPATALASGEVTAAPASVGPAAPSRPAVGPVEAPAAPPPDSTPSAASAANAPRGGVEIVLPAADERDRASVTAAFEQALARASARLGVPVPGRIRLVFHPTLDAYTQQTGQPAWSPAHATAARVDIQPIGRLRLQGELEPALAHAAARLLTNPALAGRARWVQEGAALFAAGSIGPAEIAAARRAAARACPSDGELDRPASPSAAREALERARACYARALGRDLRWDEIR